ncbi:MAG: hypothetical protein QXG65_02290 [Thermoplasmata archaeon]
MRRAARSLPVLATVAMGLLLVASVAPRAEAAPPPLPVADGGRFVSALEAPTLVAGQSGSLFLTVSDPLAVPLLSVGVTLGVYAFNGFPGNATRFGGLVDPPLLGTPNGTGLAANLTAARIPSGGGVSWTVTVQTSGGTPDGAYAVRLALRFSVPNGSEYVLRSRGWFSAALWENATVGPNGTTVLTNRSLAMLNVSGIVPETSVQVTGDALPIALYAVLAGAIVLAGAGAFVYFRRVSRGGSRAGAR